MTAWVFDCLIVGTGFAGSVLAERLASQCGKSCLVVERRNHTGGKAFDAHDAAGILLRRYGPHYFRTNPDRVVRYLSQFAEWRPVECACWRIPGSRSCFRPITGRRRRSFSTQDRRVVPTSILTIRLHATHEG